MTLALGLMSGTSGDGISAALADFRGQRFELLAYHTYPYSKSTALSVANALTLKTPQLSRLHTEIGHAFAGAALKLLRSARISPSRVAVIGSHGQTVYHGPCERAPNTLQMGEAAFIAEKTGIPVVSDFRPQDMAAGGQGAPLIPYFDNYFYGHGPVRAFQNIGGISNVCVVGGGLPPIAFDNGPGNSLMDSAVLRLSRGRKSYDAGGRLAKAGWVDVRHIRKLLRHPYFKKRPPKSTGKELFGNGFFSGFGKFLMAKPKHLLATLTFFTAAAIHESYVRFVFPKIWPKEILINGGGALNPVLMDHLAILFAPIPVRSISSLGIPPQAKEPLAFAFFALRALQGKPNHLPEATGAKHACVLGKLTPGSHPRRIHG